MPETPDFKQMARRMIDLVKVLSVEEIAAQLRLVWNARGAADMAMIEDGYVGELLDVRDALRTLDR